jgi:N-acetyl-gamma-glutamyl-phosphate reductase
MHSYASVRVGVAGATGYAGQELVRFLARHPRADLRVAMGSQAAGSSARPLPALARLWRGEVVPLDPDRLARDVDAVFLALPDAASARLGPALVASGPRVFDLSGAFRLRDSALRQRWYPEVSTLPPGVAYGLTERNRAAVRAAQLVACPGCYPTAALLALHPLAEAALLDGDVIIDAKSGISGAGKTLSERTQFSECHGNVGAYGVFGHRHAPEIEQELGLPVTFVPHLVPLDRGILETIYARLKPGVAAQQVADAYFAAYAEAPFVRLTGETLPEIKHVAHTNFCDIGWRVDATARRLVAVACLDNLVKGAAGQAVQNFNVAFGFDECAGLT